jgi:hypothetical protein
VQNHPNPFTGETQLNVGLPPRATYALTSMTSRDDACAPHSCRRRRRVGTRCASMRAMIAADRYERRVLLPRACWQRNGIQENGDRALVRTTRTPAHRRWTSTVGGCRLF